MGCNRVTLGVLEKDRACYFSSQPLSGAFLSVMGWMVLINGFHLRRLSSGLLCPHGLRLCGDVWFAVFVPIFICIDICCPLHHGHIKVLEEKHHFSDGCRRVLGDLVSTAENTACTNARLPLWKCLAVL